MADNTPQTYANHTKFVPPFHFILLPILMANLVYRIWRIYHLVSSASSGRTEAGFQLLLAIAFIMTALFARVFSLQAQDRVIRLEEQLRWQRVLSAELFSRTGEVTRPQLIALRFCPDDELPGVMARVLTMELKEPKAIKQAIKNWKPDHHRV